MDKLLNIQVLRITRRFISYSKLLTSAGDPGSGVAKGGGSGGAIKEGGGKFGEIEAAQEAVYFRKLEAQQIEQLKSMHQHEIKEEEREIERHENNIKKHNSAIHKIEKELKKKMNNHEKSSHKEKEAS